MSKRTALIFGLLLLAPLSLRAESPAGTLNLAPGVEPHESLDKIYRSFSRAYLDLEPETLADLYTEDALYLSPGSAVRRGRSAIYESFAGMFRRAGESGTSLHISFEILARQATEEMAYDVGIYRLERRRGGEVTHSSAGKFVVVALPGADGQWRFQVDGYSDLEEQD